MQAICEVGKPTRRTNYQVAGQSIVVETHDTWAAKVIDDLFAGWYLTPTGAAKADSSPVIVIRSNVTPPLVPESWPQFEIAGGGTYFTDGKSSYIELAGSIITIGKPGHDAVEVWTRGQIAIGSPALTRVVSYALAAALRRCQLFELHSGAVIDPESKQGVLIIGPSGSGKSTLTVQLAATGWPFLTDDVLLLTATGARVQAWPLRRCFAITADTFAASNFLQGRAALDYMQRGDKKSFLPERVFNSELKEHCLPQTLFFSQLSGGERSQVLRLSPAETLARLIRMNPWSCYDQITAADHVAVLSALARQATGYSLLAAKDLLDAETSAKLIAGYTRDQRDG